jgi:diguanylate cyclase (GGDEF)-like protein/PAS domain S-box-containing protein
MDSMTILNGSYDHRLVALSIVLAVFASYAALDLAGRVSSAKGWARIIWLNAGATAMGLGIWAMHYVGMLALAMPMPVYYHVPTVVLSLLSAIAASEVALFVASRPNMTTKQLLLGSLIMGGGIASMHYIGMAAMRCTGLIVYNRGIVALSIVLAVAISFIALQLAFRARDDKGLSGRKIISALTMGGAIPLMHYTGMWAADFHRSEIMPDLTNAVGISTIGILAISASSFIVLGTAIVSSFFDRFIALQRKDLGLARERELYFQTMAEASPEIMWTADVNGEFDYFNRKCLDYTGFTLDRMRGEGWKVMIHPNDLENCVVEWEKALRTGGPFEMEYRLRAGDGTFRWFLVRANPIRNPDGEIVKWFGTGADIESQKQNQQLLQGEIQERTEQLAEMNTRLQEEMIEKDFARHEMDEQNDRMMAQLKERSERATMLAKMGELLQSCVSKDEVFAAALGFAPKVFPTAPGAVGLLDASRSRVEVIASWADCQLPEAEFDPADCWALRTAHPHLVLEGDSTARCAHAAGVRHTYLCIPILAQGETLGVLHIQTTDDVPQMDGSEMSFKTTFAGQVGLSIANIRLREALRTQSVRDALTGLHNRRYLEETLEREVRRASRNSQALGILMIDLDHFKKFNDTYGHDAGDVVLRETASILAAGIRAEDFICRYGGEEFVIILPTADAAASRARAERLRAKIKELVMMYQGNSLGKLTISIGVSAYPQHGASSKEIMAAADAALYESKRKGRDRVSLAAEATSEAAVPATASS